ncbi:MAG: endonuclease domain-containing protein [Candidatus Cryosericum sp.]
MVPRIAVRSDREQEQLRRRSELLLHFYRHAYYLTHVHRCSGYWSSYEITDDDVKRMWKWQHGRCAFCGGSLGSRFVVDHEHVTGKVRGLLHGRCNTVLGCSLHDNPAVLSERKKDALDEIDEDPDGLSTARKKELTDWFESAEKYLLDIGIPMDWSETDPARPLTSAEANWLDRIREYLVGQEVQVVWNLDAQAA